MHLWVDQELACFGLCAEPGGEVHDGPNSRIFEASFEPEAAKRRIAVRYPNAESEVVAMLAPPVGQPSHARAHLGRHLDCTHRWVRAGQRIIKYDQKSIAYETLNSTLVFVDQWSEAGVVLTQDRHDFLGLGALRERRKAAQVTENNRDVTAVAIEQMLVTVVENEFGDLWRKEALEPAGSFDHRQLVCHALFERLVPIRQISGLSGDLVM